MWFLKSIDDGSSNRTHSTLWTEHFHIWDSERDMSTSFGWNVFLSIAKDKRHAGWIKNTKKKKKKEKSLALQSVLEELKKKLERKKQVVVIPCSRKTKETVYFIQGRRHVVVYIRTTGCVNLNTGLPRRLQQSTNVLTTPKQSLRDH